MIVAIPIWRGRISPVYDTAGCAAIVEFDRGREVSRKTVDLPGETLRQRVDSLGAAGVEVLLCGAISHRLREMLDAAGIRVIPFLSGDAECVLQAFAPKRMVDSRFLMPGCCGRRRRRGNGGGNRLGKRRGTS